MEKKVEKQVLCIWWEVRSTDMGSIYAFSLHDSLVILLIFSFTNNNHDIYIKISSLGNIYTKKQTVRICLAFQGQYKESCWKIYLYIRLYTSQL